MAKRSKRIIIRDGEAFYNARLRETLRYSQLLRKVACQLPKVLEETHDGWLQTYSISTAAHELQNAIRHDVYRKVSNSEARLELLILAISYAKAYKLIDVSGSDQEMNVTLSTPAMTELSAAVDDIYDRYSDLAAFVPRHRTLLKQWEAV